MTDEYLIESSQKLEEQLLERRIHEIKNRAGSHQLEPMGKCHDCGEVFDESDPNKQEKKFCDSLCESSWHDWYKAQVRKHGPGFRLPSYKPQ
jgi:rRNA maturation endonuclease Nob1